VSRSLHPGGYRACKLWKNVAQPAPVAGTWTPVTFESTFLFNYAGFTFASSPVNGVAVPANGLYRAIGKVATIANSQSFVASLTINSTGSSGTGHAWPDGSVVEAYIGATASNGASYPTLELENVGLLSKGDVIGMDVYHSIGPQPGVQGRSILVVEWLR
jgi:hypothetical protein